MKFLLLFFAAFLYAQATPVALEGTWNYNITSDHITISGGNITNTARGGNSGTLRLEVFLSKTTLGSSTSGYLNGYTVLSKQFEPLSGGYQYASANLSGDWEVRPPAGKYYVYLNLKEYSGYDYQPVSYLLFNGQLDVADYSAADVDDWEDY